MKIKLLILSLGLFFYCANNLQAQKKTFKIGTKEGTIEGTVLDDQGLPLFGASVWLEDSLRTILTVVTTDENGGYTISRSPGKYAIGAGFTGYRGSMTIILLEEENPQFMDFNLKKETNINNLPVSRREARKAERQGKRLSRKEARKAAKENK